MNRNHRRYNRNQPNNQANRSNLLPPPPPINNITQNGDSETGENNGNNNQRPVSDATKRTWQHADTIAVLALFVGIVMTVVTYNLFELSQKQAQSVIDAGDAAKRSAEISKETLDSSKSYQIQSVNASKIADSQKHIIDAATFNLQKKGFEKQIASLKETQKEFEIENEAILEITNIVNFKYDSSGMSFSYAQINYGKQPAKLISTTERVEFIYTKDTTYFLHNAFKYLEKPSQANGYVTYNTPILFPFEGGISKKANAISGIKDETILIYFFGKKIYRCNANGKYKEYVFLIQLIPYAQNGFFRKYIVDENSVIKKTPNKVK